MSTSPNPEFEYYRRHLLHRRRYYPIYGLLLVITGALGFFGVLAPYLDHPENIADITRPLWFVHVGFLFGFLIMILAGLFLGIYATKAPSTAQIQRYRRQERQRLYLQAQGRAFPWWSRLIIRILIFLVGMFFSAGGLLFIVLFGPDALDGWVYLVVGIFLLSLVFYFIPREIRKLPLLSAEQLAQNLISGEASTGE